MRIPTPLSTLLLADGSPNIVVDGSDVPVVFAWTCPDDSVAEISGVRILIKPGPQGNWGGAGIAGMDISTGLILRITHDEYIDEEWVPATDIQLTPVGFKDLSGWSAYGTSELPYGGDATSQLAFVWTPTTAWKLRAGQRLELVVSDNMMQEDSGAFLTFGACRIEGAVHPV